MTIKSILRSWQAVISLALLAALVGSMAAYAALGFVVVINWLHTWFVGESGTALYSHLAEIHWFYLFIIPVIGALIVNVIVRYGTSEQRNYGPADIIYAAKFGNGEMSLRTGLVNAIASILSIGSGASVGRYGPVVHLGATLGAWLASQFRLSESRRKTLLACGVAGAISASFYAPLAGIVFAYEVVVGRFGIKSVMPIVIASVVASMIAKFHGSGTLFNLPELFVATNWEYFLFAIVGIVGGGLAVCFMALMQKTNEIALRIPGSFLNRALLGGSLLGGILVVFPQTFGLGEQVIQDALNLEITIGLLVLLVFAKLLATSISFAAGFSGGVFGPAVYMGTMLGTAIGLGVTELFETTSSPAVYGIAGMGAVISRVIGSPIATILIVFELTGSYSLTTAVMIAVVVSNMMTQTFFNYSYFHHQLRTRGVDPEQSRAQRLLQNMPIDSLILPAPVVVTDDTMIAVVRDAIIKQDASEAYIVDHENRLLGQISATTLLRINDERTFSQPVNQFMSRPPITLTPQMNVLDTFDRLRDFVGVSVPVVTDQASNHFKGIIHESTVMHTYLKVTQQSEQEIH